MLGVNQQHGDLEFELVELKAQIKAGNRAQSNSGQGSSSSGSTSNSGDFSGVAIPKYDASFMTPSAFLAEVEEVLTWKNIPQDKRLLFIPRLFPSDSDLHRWWSAVKALVTDWDEFKAQFEAYEDADTCRDPLYEKLYAKKQKLDEPFELYAWEIHSIFMKIDPYTEQSVIIDRILNSCLAEISVHILASSVKTVAELVVQARSIIPDINRIRRAEGKVQLRARQRSAWLRSHVLDSDLGHSPQLLNPRQNRSHHQQPV